MAKSFLELLSDLCEAKTQKKIYSLTDDLSEILEKDDQYAKYFLYSMFRSIANESFSENFLSIFESEFYKAEVNSYSDDDQKTKIVINMAFLQDNIQHEENLEEKVLNSIIEYLKKNNLNILVNDISVNTLQFRNGEKVDFASYNKE